MNMNHVMCANQTKSHRQSPFRKQTAARLSDVSADNPNLLALQSQIGNRAVQRLVKTLRIQSLQRDTDEEPSPVIGYVGLNPEAYKEARALRRGAHDRVIVSLDDLKKQAVLQTKQGKRDFVEQKLGIEWLRDPAKFMLAVECLQKCDASFCEQMADMMEMFNNAQNGKYQLERLILSGHHAGGNMWGDDTDKHEPGNLLLNRDLPNLVAAFPDAAAQVEDIMFSACNTEEQVDVCVNLFPNLKSVWVYEGSSPTVKQGSAQHINQWERRTRGERLPRKRDRIGNTEIWTSEKGFLVTP